MLNKPVSIVILFPEYLGDFIMLVPFIYGLKSVFPEATIDLYTSPVAAKCAVYHPCVNRVLPIPKLRDKGRVQWAKVREFASELKSKHYDYGYFTNDYMFWPLFMGGVGTILQEQKSLLFKLTCKGTPQRYRRHNLRHAAQRHVNNIEHAFSVSIPAESYNFSLNFPDDLIHSDWIPSRPYIYINADGNSVKKYEPKFYQELCVALIEKGHLIVIDGIHDHFGLDYLASHPNVVYSVGKTSLYELFGLIKYSSLVVSVDSGPSHLACVFKRKSVIFHPPKANFPFKTAGFYKDNWSYKTSPSESACALKCSVFQACKETDCQTDYQVVDVLKLVDRALITERTWEEKAFEMLQKSVGIAFITASDLTEQQQDWINRMKQQGFFMFVQSGVDIASMSLERVHDLIKKHRLHLVVIDKEKLPLKCIMWNWWYRISEKAYVTFLPRPNYNDSHWFEQAVTRLTV